MQKVLKMAENMLPDELSDDEEDEEDVEDGEGGHGEASEAGSSPRKVIMHYPPAPIKKSADGSVHKTSGSDASDASPVNSGSASSTFIPPGFEGASPQPRASIPGGGSGQKYGGAG